MHTNPKRIFELHDQPGTTIELDLDRPSSSMKTTSTWSSLSDKKLTGTVERVFFNGQTVCLEGEIIVKESLGKDVSTHMLPTTTAKVVEVVSPVPSNATLSPAVSTGRRKRFSFSSIASPVLGPTTSFGTKLDGIISEPSIPEQENNIIKIDIPRELSPPSALKDSLRKNPFLRQHVVSVGQFSRSDLHLLFASAQEMRLAVERVGVLDLLKAEFWPHCFMSHLLELQLHLMRLCND